MNVVLLKYEVYRDSGIRTGLLESEVIELNWLLLNLDLAEKCWGKTGDRRAVVSTRDIVHCSCTS